MSEQLEGINTNPNSDEVMKLYNFIHGLYTEHKLLKLEGETSPYFSGKSEKTFAEIDIEKPLNNQGITFLNTLLEKYRKIQKTQEGTQEDIEDVFQKKKVSDFLAAENPYKTELGKQILGNLQYTIESYVKIYSEKKHGEEILGEAVGQDGTMIQKFDSLEIKDEEQYKLIKNYIGNGCIGSTIVFDFFLKEINKIETPQTREISTQEKDALYYKLFLSHYEKQEEFIQSVESIRKLPFDFSSDEKNIVKHSPDSSIDQIEVKDYIKLGEEIMNNMIISLPAVYIHRKKDNKKEKLETIYFNSLIFSFKHQLEAMGFFPHERKKILVILVKNKEKLRKDMMSNIKTGNKRFGFSKDRKIIGVV